jgi:hypothetical protein
VPTVTIIAVLNLLSGLVALLISYYAYKNNRLVGSILLKYISVGFLLLGIGLLMQAGTENIIHVTAIQALKVRGIELVAFLVYTALQLLAYGVFAWGYGLSAFSRAKAPTTTAALPAALATAAASITRKLLDLIVLILAVYVASQAGIVILLLVIVFQGFRVFSQSHSNLALMVLFGFVLIFIGHLLMLGAELALSSTVFLVGNTIEFCGFVALLFFLIWSGRVVK